jgi:hypothetical protein
VRETWGEDADAENENTQQFGPWLRVSPPNRYGGGGGGRENHKEAKVGYAQPSNSVAAEYRAKGKSKQGESGGAGSAGMDEGSTETSPVTEMDGNGKKWHSNEGEQNIGISGIHIRNEDSSFSEGKRRYRQSDEISGESIRKGGEDIIWKRQNKKGNGPTGKERRNCEEEITANNKGSNLKLNVTVHENAYGGDDSNMAFNEKILPPKGNNIYAGQWDSIKEKMTWQTVEKGAELVDNFSLESPISRVEARPPEISTDKKIEVEKGPFMFSGSKKEKVAGAQQGKKIKTQGGNIDNIKGAKGQAGKRKMQGENYEDYREGGKKNKTYMEGQGTGSSLSAGAVKQPRQSK